VYYARNMGKKKRKKTSILPEDMEGVIDDSSWRASKELNY
jgi:hypothetical protein